MTKGRKIFNLKSYICNLSRKHLIEEFQFGKQGKLKYPKRRGGNGSGVEKDK